MHSWGFLTPQPLLLWDRSELCPSPSCHMVQWKGAFKGRAGPRSWGREKKAIEQQQMRLIYFHSEGGKLTMAGGERGEGGVPWNRKLSPEEASRLLGWQPCCACTPGTELENKHTHFCYLSNAGWEKLRKSSSPSCASAQDLSCLSPAQILHFSESEISLPYHVCITVKL